jgi:tetratricopeptide (TPR) repeat protein
MSYFGLGALNASQAAHEKAKIHSAQATEKERLYIEAHYAWRVERDYPKAAGIYRQIARMFPKEKRAHYGLGEYYRRIGEYEQAIVAFEKTLRLDPNFGPGLNYAAYTYVKIGDLGKALEYAKRYAQVNPADANPFDTMGDIYVEMGEYDNALAKYKEALNVKPDFGTDFKVGYLYALREDHTQARRWAEQGVMNAPTPEMRIIASLWVCFYRYWLGSMEECLQGLKAIETSDLTSDAIRATAYWLEAWVHFEAGNPAACKQAFRNSSSFIYFTIPSLIGMGRVELKQGNIAGARSRYLEVETLSTAVPASLGDWTRFCIDVLRAELMLAHDSVDSAIEACRKMPVVELFPQYYASSLYQNTPRDRDLLARSYYAKGDIDKAIAEYEKLTAFYSERDDRYLIHPTWHYELALLYEKAGMNEKASAEYTKFLELHKNADKDLPAMQKAQERFPALKKR